MDLSMICIYAGGFLTLFVGILHTQYYKMFRWRAEFRKVTEANARIFYTIHTALFLLLFGLAYISIVYAAELSKATGIAFGMNLMLSLLWLWRTVWQLFYFKPGNDKSYLILHYGLTIVFFLLFVSYAVPLLIKLI